MKQDHSLYFDYASTTPVSDAVYVAMRPYLQEWFYNPSALYTAAKKTHAALEASRKEIATELQVRPAEVFFTAGSTEANNIVVHGVMQKYPQARVLCSVIEHDSVYVTAQQYAHAHIPVGQDGRLSIADARALITDDVVLVSCMSANNEIGTVQPIAELAALVRDERERRIQEGIGLPIYLHTDASQSFQYIKLLPHELGVDFAVFGGSKIYGPKQSAVLYKKQGIEIPPLLHGGGQEYGVRSGTENVAACIGLAAAVTETSTLRSEEAHRLQKMQTRLFDELVSRFGAEVQGSREHRLPNNVHVRFAGADNEYLVMALDEHGIMAATGSACHASSDEPSHVLRALGLDEAAMRECVRFSFGRHTTEAAIDTLVARLADILQP
jgi:cysteine desulfurase